MQQLYLAISVPNKGEHCPRRPTFFLRITFSDPPPQCLRVPVGLSLSLMSSNKQIRAGKDWSLSYSLLHNRENVHTISSPLPLPHLYSPLLHPPPQIQEVHNSLWNITRYRILRVWKEHCWTQRYFVIFIYLSLFYWIKQLWSLSGTAQQNI